jgi:hypothetical protein
VTAAAPEAGGAGGGPTVVRMLLGAHLRRLRESKGITRADAGWPIRASESKISRMELGRVGFKERDVADLLTLYGVTEESERERLLALVHDANAPGWWHAYTDVFPDWFEQYLGLEAGASMIRTYEIQFVPGLLQTKEYAQAVVKLQHGSAPKSELERRVELRATRQEVLLRQPEPVQLWAVVDEAALRRPVGNLEVMRRQVESLVELAKRPNVILQVIPFRAGGHAAVGGNFSILRFPDPDLADMVYIEQLNSAQYLDKPGHADEYAFAMERLCIQAEPPERTPEILNEIIKDISIDHG